MKIIINTSKLIQKLEFEENGKAVCFNEFSESDKLEVIYNLESCVKILKLIIKQG
jgi:uncharacterized protein YkuJ